MNIYTNKKKTIYKTFLLIPMKKSELTAKISIYRKLTYLYVHIFSFVDNFLLNWNWSIPTSTKSWYLKIKLFRQINLPLMYEVYVFVYVSLKNSSVVMSQLIRVACALTWLTRCLGYASNGFSGPWRQSVYVIV